MTQVQPIEQKPLVSRTEMIVLAKTFNIKVTMSTIHRWANESDFPLVMGQDGRTLLYAKEEFIGFMKKRLKKLQSDR